MLEMVIVPSVVGYVSFSSSPGGSRVYCRSLAYNSRYTPYTTLHTPHTRTDTHTHTRGHTRTHTDTHGHRPGASHQCVCHMFRFFPLVICLWLDQTISIGRTHSSILPPWSIFKNKSRWLNAFFCLLSCAGAQHFRGLSTRRTRIDGIIPTKIATNGTNELNWQYQPPPHPPPLTHPPRVLTRAINGYLISPKIRQENQKLYSSRPSLEKKNPTKPNLKK